MARGEFTLLEQALRAHAFSVEPGEFQHSLREDGFWLGLSWQQVAKLVRVQLTLWADDGWVVSSRVRLGIVERAMQLHVSASALCETGEALCEALLDERFRPAAREPSSGSLCAVWCCERDQAEAVGPNPGWWCRQSVLL